MNKNTFTSLGILVGAFAAAAYSCAPSTAGVDSEGLGASSSTGNTSGKATGGASSKGGAGGGNSGGSGATASTGSGGSASQGGGAKPGINVDAGQDADMTINPDAACGTGKASATLKPVNMFVMFDRSSSMNECGDGSMTPGGGATDCPTASRWDLTSAALIQFFEAPAAADLNVALRFFPDDRPAAGCTGYMNMGGPGPGPGPDAGQADAGGVPAANCSTEACAQPLVNIAPLIAEAAPVDGHEAALVAAVNAGAPPAGASMGAGTPTFVALGGAAQWAVAYQTAHPEGQAVVVLVTDGQPNGCDTNAANIAALAGDAFETAGVLTYVIGLTGSSEAQLNQIARAGGTNEGYFVSDGNGATAELLSTLIAIKGMALSCDLEVPTNDERGMEINPHLINVNYSNGPDVDPTELGYVPNQAACGTELAWYYDDPAAPTIIHLCPETCTKVKADQSATLDILAGCEPHVVAK